MLAQAEPCGYIFPFSFENGNAKSLPDTTELPPQKADC
jgi:hypothetical protein